MVGGFRTVAYVEYDRYAQGVLMSRMRDGSLDDAPIFEDVRTFDGRSLAGSIDVVSGGFPCQDVSIAGLRAGIKGQRSGLWKEFFRIIREVGPQYILVENTPGLLSAGMGIVLGDLASIRYDSEWDCNFAADFGAWHLRERVWIVADPYNKRKRIIVQQESGRQEAPEDCSTSKNHADIDSPRKLQPKGCQQDKRRRPSDTIENASNFNGNGLSEPAQTGLGSVQEKNGASQRGKHSRGIAETWGNWDAEPGVGRMVHGMAFRSHRIRCLGNGVVPHQSVPAWKKIKDMALT